MHQLFSFVKEYQGGIPSGENKCNVPSHTLCQENPLLMAFILYHQLRIDELLNIQHDGDTKDEHTRCTPKRKPIILCGDLNVAAEDIDLKNPLLSYSLSVCVKYSQHI